MIYEKVGKTRLLFLSTRLIKRVRTTGFRWGHIARTQRTGYCWWWTQVEMATEIRSAQGGNDPHLRFVRGFCQKFVKFTERNDERWSLHGHTTPKCTPDFWQVFYFASPRNQLFCLSSAGSTGGSAGGSSGPGLTSSRRTSLFGTNTCSEGTFSCR